MNARNLPFTLLTKDPRSKTLKHLEGVVLVRVIAPPRALLTFEDVLKAKTGQAVQKNDIRMKIVEKAEFDDGNACLKVQVTGWTNHLQSGIPLDKISFVDAVTGKPITAFSIPEISQSFDDDIEMLNSTIMLPKGFHNSDANAVRLVGARHGLQRELVNW